MFKELSRDRKKAINKLSSRKEISIKTVTKCPIKAC